MRVTGKKDGVAVFSEKVDFFFDLVDNHNGFFRTERAVDKIVLHINDNKSFHEFLFLSDGIGFGAVDRKRRPGAAKPGSDFRRQRSEIRSILCRYYRWFYANTEEREKSMRFCF